MPISYLILPTGRASNMNYRQLKQFTLRTVSKEELKRYQSD